MYTNSTRKFFSSKIPMFFYFPVRVPKQHFRIKIVEMCFPVRHFQYHVPCGFLQHGGTYQKKKTSFKELFSCYCSFTLHETNCLKKFLRYALRLTKHSVNRVLIRRLCKASSVLLSILMNFFSVKFLRIHIKQGPLIILFSQALQTVCCL